MITGTAIGRISRAGKVISPAGKSPFLATTICSRKEWGGKTYDTYVEVLVYGKHIESLAPKLVMNALAAATGELSKSEDGKYTNLKLMGQIEVLSAPTTAPAATTSSKPAQKPSPAEEDPDSDVPF
jgi:hypothetical protein